MSALPAVSRAKPASTNQLTLTPVKARPPAAPAARVAPHSDPQLSPIHHSFVLRDSVST